MKSTFKHSISLLLSLALAFSLMTVGASAEEFADMPTGWSKEAVASAVENGLLRGNNGKLDPTGLLTRAQLATVIVRAFGASTEADLSGFTDVDADSWYYSALAKAKGMAVMNGTGGSTMSPDRPISRQEVFVLLARALKLADGKAEALNVYKDADSVAAWAVGGTAAMVSAGYVNGGDGCLLPTDNMTREQFAQILYNIFGTYYQAAGVYTDDVNGSLLVNVPDVTIKNAKITGDLVVGDGVGEGDLTLQNVSIGGRLVVRGGGVNSIHIKGSAISSVVISKENGAVRVVTDRSSHVEYITIADGKDDIIIEGNVDTIAIENEAVPVVLKNATVDTLQVNGSNAEISLVGRTKVSTLDVAEGAEGVKLDKEKSTTVKTLNTESDITVTGDGKISNITGSGKPTDEKGEEVKPTIEPTYDDSNWHSHTYAAEWMTDDTHHWHAATCEHKDEKGSYGTHDYSTLVSDTATCTEAGTRVMSCICGKTVQQDSSARGHSFAESWSKDETYHWHAATCEHTAEVDGKAAHTWNDGVITTPAKCLEAGVKTFTCTVCGATKTQPVAATGHSFAESWSKDEAYHWHAATCEHTAEVDGKAAHTWNDGVITTPAKCLEAGVKTFTCTVCSATKTEPIAALGHDFTNGETSYDADGHWHICGRDNCTATDTKVPHSYDTTNCAQAAHCACGYTKPAGEHNWGAWSKVDGATHQRVCSSCSTPETAAHTLGAWTYGALDGKHYKKCTTCGEMIETADHAWNNGEITTPAGCTEAGVKTFTCTDCGATKTEPVAAGHKPASTWSKDATNHWHACTNTGCTEKLDNVPHNYDPTTGKCVCGAVKPAAQSVAAPKGIVSMEQSGFGLMIRMEAPEDISNINYFLITFYEDGKRDASAATCGIAADSTDFWIRHTSFNPAYNYNKVEITAYAAEGYANAVWTDDVSMTQTRPTLQATWTYADPRLNIRFSAAAPGFYNIGVWNGDTQIENNSSYSYAYDNGLAVSRSLNQDEAAAITAGTATVKVEGWNVTQAEKVNGKWTVAFTSYSGTATKEVHVAAAAWSKDADSHWHACTNTGCTEKLDKAEHSFDPDTNKCVCGMEKPTGDYLLIYTMKDGKPIISSSIPTTTGKYRLVFSGNGVSYDIGIGSNDYSTYPLDVMFAGMSAATYTKLEWTETINNVTTTIATLNKSLTIAYSGDAIGIKTFNATRNDDPNYEMWDMEFTVNGTLDPNASYMLYHRNANGGGSGCISLNIENGKLVSTNGSSDYAANNTVMLYVLKVTGSVDDSGNATLTYTPLGSGYAWTVPNDCEHSWGSWNSSHSTRHSRTCSLCGQEEWAAHTWGENNACSACELAKPEDPTYTLAYEEKQGRLVLTYTSALPTPLGGYSLYFTDANHRFLHRSNSFLGTDCSELGLILANQGEELWLSTDVTLYDMVSDVELDLAWLHKQLTVTRSGDPISITGVEATGPSDSDDPWYDKMWTLKLTTDVTLDSDAAYVLCDENVLDSYSSVGALGYIWFENGAAYARYYEGVYTTGMDLYLLKVTASVDESGNAALTYTPVGTGYSWTLPNAEGSN